MERSHVAHSLALWGAGFLAAAFRAGDAVTHGALALKLFDKA